MHAYSDFDVSRCNFISSKHNLTRKYSCRICRPNIEHDFYALL